MFRWRWWCAALFLLLCDLYLFGPIWTGRRCFFFGDLSLYFIPQLAFQKQELLQGRLPLWNPYLFCGQPFVGNPQTWVLYPSSLLLASASAEQAASLGSALHSLLAALGMLLFLRQRRCGVGAATLGALAFAYSGALISKAQFPNMLQAASWLPWLLLTIELVLEQPTVRRIAGLGLVCGLAVLSAHAQITLMQFYAALAWLGLRLPQFPAELRWRRLGMVALGGALGLLTTLGALLPLVQYAKESSRPELTLIKANRFYLGWESVSGFLAPNLLGNPATDREWTGRGNFWEPCCYLGVLPFVSAIVGLVRWKRLATEARLWGALAVLATWLAMGRYAGLYIIAYYILPGVKQFHDPARFLYLTTFALATLAAQTVDPWLCGRPLRAVVLCVLAALDLLPFARSLNPTTPVANIAAGREQLRARLAGTKRILHTEPFRGWGRFANYRSYHSVATDAQVQAFLASGTPNLPMGVGVVAVNGYEPVPRADIEGITRYISKRLERRTELALRGSTERGEPQRHWLVGLGVEATLGLDAYASAPEALPVAPTRPRAALDPGGTLPFDTLTAQDLTPQRVRIVLPDGHPAGQVILLDTRAPGWQARVDGRDVPLDEASAVFRAVPVGASTHRVEFRYDPAVWRVGLFLSLCGACILWLLTIYSAGRE